MKGRLEKRMKHLNKKGGPTDHFTSVRKPGPVDGRRTEPELINISSANDKEKLK